MVWAFIGAIATVGQYTRQKDSIKPIKKTKLSNPDKKNEQKYELLYILWNRGFVSYERQ